MARDGINLLNHLNIDKAHILGTSMGGMISQILCAKYPDRVKTYTLIASTASGSRSFKWCVKRSSKDDGK
jgi:pimeloyl-ACP methyl ester carboxylesterase